METQIARYMLYAVGVLAVVPWALILIPRWNSAAQRRGGEWELEALLFLCGPIAATLVAFYPADGSGPGALGYANRLITNLAYFLAILGIARGANARGKKPTGLLAALLVYYFSLIASGIGGVVPGIPEAYWLTPLVVLAFVLNAGCTLEWFLRSALVSIRIIVVLSLISPLLVPEVAFNTADIRTVFGIDRLQGITSHPNTLGILAAVGCVLELQRMSRLRYVWRLGMIVAVVLAQSSTAYLALIAGVLLISSRFGRVLRTVALSVGALGAAMVLVSTEVSGAVSSFLTTDEATKLLNGRTGIWEAALVGFYQNPILGYGPSLLDAKYRQLYLPNFASAGQAHNQWYQTLGEAGLFGTVALVVLAIVMTTYAVRNRVASDGLSLALLAIFVIRSVSETPLRPAGLSLVTLFLVVVLGPLALNSRTGLSKTPPSQLSDNLEPFAALPASRSSND